MREVPVERRVYLPASLPPADEGEPCAACGRRGLHPWFLHRDRERRVWRRWVCAFCEAFRDRPEEGSA
jgi:hypothetical protein